MSEQTSIQDAVVRLRQAGQALGQAIERRDGEAAQTLAKRYEQALHEALHFDSPQRDALIREECDSLQQKIDAARTIQAEISGEIREIGAKRTLMGGDADGSARGGRRSFTA